MRRRPLLSLHALTVALVAIVLASPATAFGKGALYCVEPANGCPSTFKTWDDAVSRLEEKAADLIVICYAFDEMRPFRLLQYLRQGRRRAHLPTILVRALPVPLGKNEEIAKILSLLHWCGAMTIILLILAHLSGVIYHTFVRRDGLLKRMT